LLVAESHEGGRGIRVAAEPGTRITYHGSACGKALLAHLSEGEREVILSPGQEHANPRFAVHDTASLRAELERVRTLGYAVNQSRTGSTCVAAPVFGALGRVVCAI